MLQTAVKTMTVQAFDITCEEIKHLFWFQSSGKKQMFR